MVETALTFPIFIALLLGAVELGDIAYKSEELTNAARTAAQYAATNSGAYTDCTGSVPGSTPVSCNATSGIYVTAKNDAPLAKKACTNFDVKAASSCACGATGGTCAPATGGGYVCSNGKAVIMVSVYTSAQCSPVASVPNLFPVGTQFTLTGFSQQEVTE
jgi:Flp pilus assembly protein TadG